MSDNVDELIARIEALGWTLQTITRNEADPRGPWAAHITTDAGHHGRARFKIGCGPTISEALAGALNGTRKPDLTHYPACQGDARFDVLAQAEHVARGMEYETGTHWAAVACGAHFHVHEVGP